jgi:NitT/TauT family transport system substrate-binding protein
VNRQRSLVFIALVFALLLLAGLAGCTGKQTGRLTTVRFCEPPPAIINAPLYVAFDSGFFREQGLSVEISPPQDSDAIAPLMSDAANISLGCPEPTVYFYQKGMNNYAINFAVVASLSSPHPDYVRPGAPHSSNQDAGLDAGRECGAQAHSGPGTGLKDCGAQEAGGEEPYTCLIASKSFIEQHPDVIQKMTVGLYLGQQWVDRHDPEEIAKALLQFFPDSDLDLLTSAVSRYKSQGVWKTTPLIEYQDFARMEDGLVQSGRITKPVDPAILVNQEFAWEAIRNIP